MEIRSKILATIRRGFKHLPTGFQIIFLWSLHPVPSKRPNLILGGWSRSPKLSPQDVTFILPTTKSERWCGRRLSSFSSREEVMSDSSMSLKVMEYLFSWPWCQVVTRPFDNQIFNNYAKHLKLSDMPKVTQPINNESGFKTRPVWV